MWNERAPVITPYENTSVSITPNITMANPSGGHSTFLSTLNPLATIFVPSLPDHGMKTLNPLSKAFTPNHETIPIPNSINIDTPNISLELEENISAPNVLNTSNPNISLELEEVLDISTPNISLESNEADDIGNTDNTLRPEDVSYANPCASARTQHLGSSIRPSEPCPSSEGTGVTIEENTTTQDQNTPLEINDSDDPKSLLQKLRVKHRDRPIIAHLNINFLNPKFEPLQDIIKENVDIMLISETKLDDTFPAGTFFIEGYKEPIRLDRNRNGGGLLFYIRDDLDSKEIKSHKLPKEVEGIFIKLVIRNTKWLIMGGYNPNKKNISNFLEHVSKELDKFLPQYENLLLLGDFNSEMCEDDMKNFCETYHLTNLITDPTCFKSV